MNKYLKLLMVLLLAFLFVPMVKAEELPTSGATYFMHYPDGHEEATENYNEASNAGEKLIYSGVTDANGEVPLCGWDTEGEIRVVQHVPDGYTTNTRELVIDLSDSGTASFVNYKGLVNPSTGSTLLFIVVIAAVAGITVVARRNKKALMMIPVGIVAFLAINTKAEGTCFCIKIKDGNGNALSGVTVDVYAKPVVEAAPAVKFDAAGGHFFDGTTEMYFRLPSSSCTFDELMNSLTEDEYYYWGDNTDSAYRSGYYHDWYEIPTTLTNGTVISLIWYEDSNSKLLTINGNGGTYDFYGRKLDTVVTYLNNNPSYFMEYFTNGNKVLIGEDSEPDCSSYNTYGLKDASQYRDFNPMPKKTLYLCWHDNPDGIYANGEYFHGSIDTCFVESGVYWNDEDEFGLYRDPYSDPLYFYDITGNNVSFEYSGFDELISPKTSNEIAQGFQSLKIVYHGQTVVEITSADVNKVDGEIVITNQSKKNALKNYLTEFKNSCMLVGVQ